MYPEGYPSLGVTLMGEALGAVEAVQGGPFRGPAGFRFERMIERAGFKRDQFSIINAAFCQPPGNREPTEIEIDHCRQYWEHLVLKPECKVIVPMGNVPLFATTGHEGILSKRGYVEWSEKYQCFILPTVHPSFIMRGNSKWEAAWMYDIRHAVEVAREGWEPVVRENYLDPDPLTAMKWTQHFDALNTKVGPLALGCDIETPDKETAEDETDINLGYLAGPIHRIGFAYVWQGKTYTLSIPWDPSYIEVIAFILSLRCIKVWWNRHFDIPRIKAHNVIIEADNHDGAEMWHTLHTDLPKKLEHVAPFTCPRQPAWKHLNVSGSQAFYNATDAGVQVESYYAIKQWLEQYGMWELYMRDVHKLNTILVFMGDKGMPVDQEKRKEASYTCGELKKAVVEKLNVAASEARPSKVYTKPPKTIDLSELQEVRVEKEEQYCSECEKKATKTHPHFRCGGAAGEVPLGEARTRVVSVRGWSKKLDFKPSQKGLIRYAQFRGYKLITRWDKASQTRKVTMDETAVRQYALSHTDDKLWPLVLDIRELNVLLGTFIGKLTTEPEKVRTGDQAWWEAFNAARNKQAYSEARPELEDRMPRLRTPTEYVPTWNEDDDSIPF